MNTAQKMNVTVDVDAEELWSAVFGSGFQFDEVTRSWMVRYHFIEGDWETPGIIKIWTVEDGYCGEFTIDQLLQALSIAISEGYNHVPCGGKIDTDFSNYDSCVADLLLQIMVYGKEIYA